MKVLLTQDKWATLEPADAWVLNGNKWVADKRKGRYYAVRNRNGKREYMHRLVAGAKPGELVDHIDGDSLNNRRENLRLCTRRENTLNARGKNSESGYKGVARVKHLNKWSARIMVHGKNLYLGVFVDAKEAALAYDAAAKKHFGEFARTNF